MMIITNKSKKTIIARNAKHCTSIFSQSLGLMLQTRIIPLLFTLRHKRRETIHSFFMLKPIDIIYLDEKKKVVDFTTLHPWSWHTPREKASYVIELPKGTIQKTRTTRGDTITFE